MESISIFEMIKIGIGPSSSHTMGPWIASGLFLQSLNNQNYFSEIQEIYVYCYGSLAKTGHGHGTDQAILLGLSGENYQTIDPATIPQKIKKIKSSNKILLQANREITFYYDRHLVFEKDITLPYHANGMSFKALLKDGTVIEEKYYSLGGGFVATEDSNTLTNSCVLTPYPCHCGAHILKHCEKLGISISDLIYLNEESWRTKVETQTQAKLIWKEIQACVYRGVHQTGVLPGGLNVKRRAFDLNKKLLQGKTYSNQEEWLNAIKSGDTSFNTINKWVSCFALAVNEENASFGRVVTAPTNGAAGVIPAVLLYAFCFTPDFSEEHVTRFLLTAGLIATIFKKNATISAAMGGCQAEIGVSSSMAAAALTECLGGSPGQVLMAAEIAMEHHLGLTCDPVAGLVQIPCIERNSMGAIKAITASNIALESDPLSAKISLDDVVHTMWETAKDMHSRYKETSEGGLAIISVNITEC